MKTYKIKIDGKEYEVLGCPFCSSTPRFTEYFGGTSEIACVYSECRAAGVSFNNYGNDEEQNDAIKRWNKRAS